MAEGKYLVHFENEIYEMTNSEKSVDWVISDITEGAFKEC